MSNVVLAWPNQVDMSAVSGGSWLPTLPLTNIKNRILAKRARSTDLLTASTRFDVVLPQGKPLTVLALASHNFSVDSKLRLRFYSDNMMTNLVEDTGEIATWPAIFSSDGLEWEFDNFWAGTISEMERAEFTPLFTYFTQNFNIIQSIKVDILDPNNTSGYVEFGRLFIGNAWSPEINMTYGVEFSHDIQTEVETTLDQTEYFDRKRPRRTMSFGLDALNVDEAFNRIQTLQRQQGIDREVLVAYEKEAGQYFYQRTFLARLAAIDPIAQPYIDRYSSNINLIEII